MEAPFLQVAYPTNICKNRASIIPFCLMRQVQIATYIYLHWTPGIKQHVGLTSWVNSTKFLTGNHKSDHVFLVAKAVSAIASENHRFSSQKVLQPCAVITLGKISYSQPVL